MPFIVEDEEPTKPVKESSLWVDKYRPTKLEDYIGNEAVKEKCKEYLEKQDIPHLLLFGPAGTGKTTLAKLLGKNINCDILYINASAERGIDTIRDKMKNFACSAGFKPLKMVILDECLDENTLVWILRDGKQIAVPIKDVDPNNDLVKSYNFNLNKIEWRPFDVLDKGYQDAYELSFENGQSVICTKNHKWYVKTKDGIKKVKTEKIIDGTYSSIICIEEDKLTYDTQQE